MDVWKIKVWETKIEQGHYEYIRDLGMDDISQSRLRILDSGQTFQAASDHALFWKHIQIGWKYSHVTQKVSEGTNVPNVLTGRRLQRTKKNLGLS